MDFCALSALQRAGNSDAAGALLADAARGLVAGDAELVVISANTMHLVVDESDYDSPNPLLDTARLHARAAVDEAE